MYEQSLMRGYRYQKAHGTALLLRWLWWDRACGSVSMRVAGVGWTALWCGLQQHVPNWKGVWGLNARVRGYAATSWDVGCRACLDAVGVYGIHLLLEGRWKHRVNKGKNCRNAQMVECCGKIWGIWVMLLKHCSGFACMWGGGLRWW